MSDTHPAGVAGGHDVNASEDLSHGRLGEVRWCHPDRGRVRRSDVVLEIGGCSGKLEA